MVKKGRLRVKKGHFWVKNRRLRPFFDQNRHFRTFSAISITFLLNHSVPYGVESFSAAMKCGAEIYQNLKNVIKKKYGQDATNVGAEGGFAPNILANTDALDLVVEAIELSGYTGKVGICMDVAASEFWVDELKKYDLDFKSPAGDFEDKSRYLTPIESGIPRVSS